MADAKTLNCPQCGAPVQPDATSCPYCNSPLALVACPSCFANIFRGARHCPYCGASTERQAVQQKSPGQCPGCRNPLASVTVGSVTLAECASCGGLWVDPTAFERICSEREEQSVVLATTAHVAPAAAPLAGGAARYRPCPVCSKLMNRTNFARASGVIIDVCKGHGIWFDHDELRRIVEFIRGGGLEHARELEKEDLRDERERLRAAQLQSRLENLRSSEWSGSRSHLGSGLDYGDILSAASGLLRGLF
jgi:Zn-finger nucleic acid-binding protein